MFSLFCVLDSGIERYIHKIIYFYRYNELHIVSKKFYILRNLFIDNLDQVYDLLQLFQDNCGTFISS